MYRLRAWATLLIDEAKTEAEAKAKAEHDDYNSDDYFDAGGMLQRDFSVEEEEEKKKEEEDDTDADVFDLSVLMSRLVFRELQWSDGGALQGFPQNAADTLMVDVFIVTQVHDDWFEQLEEVVLPDGTVRYDRIRYSNIVVHYYVVDVRQRDRQTIVITNPYHFARPQELAIGILRVGVTKSRDYPPHMDDLRMLLIGKVPRWAEWEFIDSETGLPVRSYDAETEPEAGTAVSIPTTLEAVNLDFTAALVQVLSRADIDNTYAHLPAMYLRAAIIKGVPAHANGYTRQFAEWARTVLATGFTEVKAKTVREEKEAIAKAEEEEANAKAAREGGADADTVRVAEAKAKVAREAEAKAKVAREAEAKAKYANIDLWLQNAETEIKTVSNGSKVTTLHLTGEVTQKWDVPHARSYIHAVVTNANSLAWKDTNANPRVSIDGKWGDVRVTTGNNADISIINRLRNPDFMEEFWTDVLRLGVIRVTPPWIVEDPGAHLGLFVGGERSHETTDAAAREVRRVPLRALELSTHPVPHKAITEWAAITTEGPAGHIPHAPVVAQADEFDAVDVWYGRRAREHGLRTMEKRANVADDLLETYRVNPSDFRAQLISLAVGEHQTTLDTWHRNATDALSRTSTWLNAEDKYEKRLTAAIKKKTEKENARTLVVNITPEERTTLTARIASNLFFLPSSWTNLGDPVALGDLVPLAATSVRPGGDISDVETEEEDNDGQYDQYVFVVRPSESNTA